jgi:hypothetical protein
VLRALQRGPSITALPINAGPGAQFYRMPSRRMLSPSHEEIEDLWGLYPIWHPDTNNSQISKEDAAELIAPRALEALSPEFVLDWLSRPEDERNAIDAQTEEYRDYADLQERKIFSSGFRAWIENKLPTAGVYAESIQNIVVALAGEPEIRSNPAYAEEKLRQIESLIRTAWGIEKKEAHRPLDMDEQHREWSRKMYLGHNPKDLAKEAEVTPEHVRTNVYRHRERTAVKRWLIRAAILYST